MRRLARLGREAGLVQVWDLMHYGYPDDLDPLADAAGFVARFAAYAGAVAAAGAGGDRRPAVRDPGERALLLRLGRGRGGLPGPLRPRAGARVQAGAGAGGAAAAAAVWAVDSRGRMVSVDPLVRVHAPPGRPDLRAAAAHFNRDVVFEAFDLLAGRREPDLGGSRAHLGVVGLNYYAGNQWTLPAPDAPQRFLTWDDPAWLPLSDLLAEVQARYGGPLLLAETGAAGEARPAWLAHLTGEVGRALARGVDLRGVCWYPVVTSPDWEDPTAFFEGGLFDVAPRPDGRLERVLARPVAAALRAAQAALDPANAPVAPPEPEKPAPPARPARPPAVLRPLERVRAKADNFSYQTLAAGEALVVEAYAFEPGAGLTPHRHPETEHVLTALTGAGVARVGRRALPLRAGELLLVPAGAYHGLHNPGPGRLVVQQVSGPKPWDARFAGPHPGEFGGSPAAAESPGGTPTGCYPVGWRLLRGCHGEPARSAAFTPSQPWGNQVLHRPVAR